MIKRGDPKLGVEKIKVELCDWIGREGNIMHQGKDL